MSGQIGWQEGLPREIPPSLYLSEKPAFFGDHPWPWVEPDHDGAIHVLPARERFDLIHETESIP